jgi:CBS domain containing-hemolysin-like protein
MTFAFEMAGLAGLILLNAFFVAAEYGLVTSRRTRIMELQHQGNKRARAVLTITGDPSRFIAAMNRGGWAVIWRTSRARVLPWSRSSVIRVRRAVTSPYSAATKNAFSSRSPATASS